MRRREFIAGLVRAARAQAERVRRIGVLMSAAKTILRERPDSPGSRRGLRSWVGPMAATCGWTFVGPPATLTGCGCSRKSWSTCNPT